MNVTNNRLNRKPYARTNRQREPQKGFVSALIVVLAQAGTTKERSQLEVLEDDELPFREIYDQKQNFVLVRTIYHTY